MAIISRGVKDGGDDDGSLDFEYFVDDAIGEAVRVAPVDVPRWMTTAAE